MSSREIARARYGTRCECGRRKNYQAECCHECPRLDGIRATRDVVQALRSLGGAANLDALAVELGTSRATAARQAARMVVGGRLVRHIVPGYTEDSRANARGGADVAVFVLVTPEAW